jgi:hypothetical protein
VNHSSPQERGCEDHPPDVFPSSIEALAEKQRDDWDVLISALQIRDDSSCPHIEYIDTSLNRARLTHALRHGFSLADNCIVIFKEDIIE